MAAAGTSCSRSCASCSYCRLSRSSIKTKSGITTNMIQASSKRVIRTITTTKAERNAPTPLMTRLTFQPGSRRRRWWRVMPAWESVKPTKTPMA